MSNSKNFNSAVSNIKVVKKQGSFKGGIKESDLNAVKYDFSWNGDSLPVEYNQDMIVNPLVASPIGDRAALLYRELKALFSEFDFSEKVFFDEVISFLREMGDKPTLMDTTEKRDKEIRKFILDNGLATVSGSDKDEDGVNFGVYSITSDGELVRLAGNAVGGYDGINSVEDIMGIRTNYSYDEFMGYSTGKYNFSGKEFVGLVSDSSVHGAPVAIEYLFSVRDKDSDAFLEVDNVQLPLPVSLVRNAFSAGKEANVPLDFVMFDRDEDELLSSFTLGNNAHVVSIPVLFVKKALSIYGNDISFVVGSDGVLENEQITERDRKTTIRNGILHNRLLVSVVKDNEVVGLIGGKFWNEKIGTIYSEHFNSGTYSDLWTSFYASVSFFTKMRDLK